MKHPTRGSAVLVLLPIFILGAVALTSFRWNAQQSATVAIAIAHEKERFGAFSELLRTMFSTSPTPQCMTNDEFEVCHLTTDSVALDLGALIDGELSCESQQLHAYELFDSSSPLSAVTCINPVIDRATLSTNGNVALRGYSSPMNFKVLVVAGQLGAVGRLTFTSDALVIAAGGVVIDELFVPKGATVRFAAFGPIRIGKSFGEGMIVKLTTREELRQIIPTRAPLIWYLRDRAGTQ